MKRYIKAARRAVAAGILVPGAAALAAWMQLGQKAVDIVAGKPAWVWLLFGGIPALAAAATQLMEDGR